MSFTPPSKDIVWVEWEDAVSQEEHLLEGDEAALGLAINTDLGWIIHNNDRRIVLCSAISTSGEKRVRIIPKSWIVNIIPLRSTRAKQTSKATRRVPVSVDITETAGRTEPGPRA